MNEEQITEIKRLNTEGYSPRDIADELKIEIDQVETVLASSDEAATDGGKENGDIDDDDLETIAKVIDRLRREKAELAQERERVAAERQELTNKMGQLPQHEEQYESFKTRTHRAKMTARFNYLLNELIEDCQKSTWSGAEVDDYLERASSLREKVKKFCDGNRIDERRLLIFQGLGHVIEKITAMQKNQTSGLFSGRSVRFDFKPETKAAVEAFRITDFEDEIQQSDATPPQAPEADDELWDED